MRWQTRASAGHAASSTPSGGTALGRASRLETCSSRKRVLAQRTRWNGVRFGCCPRFIGSGRPAAPATWP
eukprot:11193485-Lingulodinium_polyedra.AAC.1